MAASTAIQRINALPIKASPIKNMVTCLIGADLLTLLISVAFSLACKSALSGIPVWDTYLRLWPFLFVFIAVYGLVGLYSGMALSPPEELRRATLSSTLVFLVLSAATVYLRGANRYFTWTMLLAMFLSVVLLPLVRSLTRHVFSKEPWWGTPAVIFGSGPDGQRVVSTLLSEPGLGLNPVAVVDDDPSAPLSIHGVPVLRGFELQGTHTDACRSAYAVVAMPNVPSSEFLSMIDRHRLNFSHILMIPNLANFCSLWVNPRSVGGMLGLEVHQQAFVRERHWPKRALDVFLTVAGGMLILPLIAFIALWIKLDSPGPAFYAHERIGQDGKQFGAWKFRSMVQNADQILERYLDNNPNLRAEWEQNHKLKDDPRITYVGRFLRKTSLDELPQLWNVIRGEMSLVGPRPIVLAEIPKYGQRFDLYTKVKSGLTGMWQISGRSDTSYNERVNLDSFYVSNWSVWLDLYILVRTVETVIFRQGAY
jgi:Undecaprenyl-phosphate galactose phosphotransferase WbaP